MPLTIGIVHNVANVGSTLATVPLVLVECGLREVPRMLNHTNASGPAIDIRRETLLTFTQAVKRLPERRGGKRPHVHTLYRWSSKGLRGVRLESIYIGGTRCTSVEALQRFFERLTVSQVAELAAPEGLVVTELAGTTVPVGQLAKSVLRAAGILEEEAQS